MPISQTYKSTPTALTNTRSGANAAIWYCFIPIVFYIASFSRIVQLFTNMLATLTIAGSIFSLSCLFLVGRQHRTQLIVFSISIIGVGLFYEYVFILNTGLIGDFRALGNLLGDLTVIPFAAAIERIGIKRTIELFARVVYTYVFVYVAFSIPITMEIFLPREVINSAILYNSDRGYRLFACYSLIAFALAYAALGLKERKDVASNAVLFSVTALAIYLHKERIPQAESALLLVFVFLLPRFSILLAARLYILIYAVMAFVLYEDFSMIYDFLYNLNDPSLSIRLDSVSVASDVLSKYPYFGLGFPADDTLHERVLGFLYFPEDLGVMGQFASMGPFGPIFIGFLCLLSARSIRVGLACQLRELDAVCLAGLYLVFATAVTMTIYRGEGGIVFGLLLSCLFMLSDKPAVSVRSPDNRSTSSAK